MHNKGVATKSNKNSSFLRRKESFKKNLNIIQSSSSSTQIDIDNKIIIYGKHPVYEVLRVKRRKIFAIYATNHSILDLKSGNLIDNNLTQIIKIVDSNFIDQICGKDKTHQGLAIIASKVVIKGHFDLLKQLHDFDNSLPKPAILILDELTDPHNVGAIIRSAIAFGVKKIVFCAHNAVSENSTIIKSSAGMIEYAELFVVSGINNLIDKLKKLDYWCIGLASEGELKTKSLTNYPNIALIVGSEGSGLRSLVKKNCDFLLAIKMEKQVESLNVSVATAIALHEIYSRDDR